MYFSSVGGTFFKAQVQNHYEKIRCDLYIKDVAKRHVHSLTNINKNIKEARDALRDIRASSGHCKEVKEYETASKSNFLKEQERSTRKSQPNDGNPGRSETPARRKSSVFQEIKSKNLDSGEQPTASKTSIDGVGRGSLFREKSEQNILEQSEYSMHGKNGAGSGNAGREMNGDRSDIVPAGGLLRDEILSLTSSRNAGGRDIGTNRQRLDSFLSDFKESQRKSREKSKSSANGSNFPNTDITSSKHVLTSRTDEPPESAKGTSKLRKSRPNTVSDGLTGNQSQTVPEKASRLKSQMKSAPVTERKLEKSSRSRYLSANEGKKVKIHVSISRTERKKILRELISSCAVPCDRSVLERERQRRLQEKIHRFFELLFERDDQDEEDDESDIFGDN